MRQTRPRNRGRTPPGNRLTTRPPPVRRSSYESLCPRPSSANEGKIQPDQIGIRRLNTVGARGLRLITRLEIDGFKTFEAFSVDLSPFTVILGSNAAGKSNLFDAIQLLSHLATEDLRTAFRRLRGEPELVFRQPTPDSWVNRIRLATEVLLEPVVTDPWGAQVELRHTRIRYEVVIARTAIVGEIPRLTVVGESATPILSNKDTWRPYGKKPAPDFRSAHLRYSRRDPWLETADTADRPEFRIRQDGRHGRSRPANAAEATVLSSITTTEFAHLYALREEMRRWRLLQLDPAGLRQPSPLTADDELSADGSNIAAVLYRIQAETRTDQNPKGLLPEIAAELSAIIPGVLAIDATRDDSRREFQVELTLRRGFHLPTALASDGTLRVLALLTALNDPKHGGVICFEEPENGVHPGRLRALIDHLTQLVTDPSSTVVDEPSPLAQLLMNSHSPVILSASRDATNQEILMADLIDVVANQEMRTKTRLRKVNSRKQTALLEAEDGTVGAHEVQRILDTVEHEA